MIGRKVVAEKQRIKAKVTFRQRFFVNITASEVKRNVNLILSFFLGPEQQHHQNDQFRQHPT